MQVLENRDQWWESSRNGWLAHYQQTGRFDWEQYTCPRNSVAPAGPGVDLARSRLMLVSSAGTYLRERQQPFDAANPLGDYTIRLVPSSTQWDAVAIAHELYDHAAVEEDPQVLLPLRHLHDMVAEGSIGELAPSIVSFMGYQPDVTRVVDEMLPAILEAARAEDVDAALLVPA